jgi:hypothetical protein
MSIKTPSFLSQALQTVKQAAKTVPSWIVRQITPENIGTGIGALIGLAIPGEFGETPLLASTFRAMGGAMAGRSASSATPVEAAERIVPTAGVAPAQVPKAEERVPAGPQIVASTIPGQVSPTPVIQRLPSTPTTPTPTPTPTPAASEKISPPISAPTPTPTRITTGLTPPTGAGVIPSPVVPSAIIQKEQVGAPPSEVIKQLMEAAMRVGEERPVTVQVPIPEPLEARARPRTLEELIAELLKR